MPTQRQWQDMDDARERYWNERETKEQAAHEYHKMEKDLATAQEQNEDLREQIADARKQIETLRGACEESARMMRDCECGACGPCLSRAALSETDPVGGTDV